MSAQPLPPEAKERLETLRGMLTHIYNSKNEVNTRAFAIITTNTLFMAIAAFSATLLINLRLHLSTNHFSFWPCIVGGTIGFFSIMVSQFMVLQIYNPIIVYKDSLFEPEVLSEMSPAMLTEQIGGSSIEALMGHYATECVSLSKVQVFRAHRVRMSVAVSFVSMAGFCVALFFLSLNIFTRY